MKIIKGLIAGWCVVGSVAAWAGTDGTAGGFGYSPTGMISLAQVGTWYFRFQVPYSGTVDVNGRVATGGMAPGGGVRLDIPSSWTPPQMTDGNIAGYVAVTASVAATPVITITNQSIYAQFASSLASGVWVTLAYGSTAVSQNGRVQAPSEPGVSGFRWYSDLDGVSNGREPGNKSFAMLATALSLRVVGPPTSLRFSTDLYAVQTSTLLSLVVKTADEFGGITFPATADTALTLWAVTVDPVTGSPIGPRTSLTLYADGTGTTPLSTAPVILSGANNTWVYFRDGQSGTAQLFLAKSGETDPRASVNVTVMDTGPGSVSIDAGVRGTLATTSITPDGDGREDVAYVRFTLERTVDWEVRFDMNQDGTFAAKEFFYLKSDKILSGRGASVIASFNGRGYIGNGAIGVYPSGTYPVQIIVGSRQNLPAVGMTFTPAFTHTGLTLILGGAGLTGSVKADGAAVAFAEVKAWNATLGTWSAVSASDGVYRLVGLKAGSYTVSVKKGGFEEQSVANVSVAANATAPLDLTLVTGATVRVLVVRPSGTYTDELWAGVEASNSTRQVAWGTVHFGAGTETLADNGYWNRNDTDAFKSYVDLKVPAGAIGFKVWGLVGLGSNTWSVVGTTLSGNTEKATLTLAGGQSLTLQFNVTRQAVIRGEIARPAELPVGQEVWIGVTVTPYAQPNDYQQARFGGVWFPSGTLSGGFTITAPDGAYQLKGNLQGYIPYSHPTGLTVAGDTVTPASVTLGASAFQRGASITGTIFVAGGGTLASDKQSFWLSVWNGGYGTGTPIRLTTSSTPFTVGGLSLGTWNMYTNIPGYDMDSLTADGKRQVAISTPTSVVAVSLTLRSFDGEVEGQVTFGSDASPDYTKIRIQANPLVTGFSARSTTLVFDGTRHTYLLTNLGTASYTVNAIYQGTAKTHPSASEVVRVVNGKRAVQNFNLAGATYKISGTVTTASLNISLNTIAKITAYAPNNFMARAALIDELGERAGVGFSSPIIPSTLGPTVGTFTIPNLAPGTYRVFVPGGLGSGAGGIQGNWLSARQLTSTDQMMTIKHADLTGVNVPLTDGNSISGTITPPSSETTYGRITLKRITPPSLKQECYIQLTFIAGTPVSYEFKRLWPGKWVVQVTGDAFASASQLVDLVSSDETVDFNLAQGATIAFKLRDLDGGALITADNEDQYLAGVDIFVRASPWVEGGWKSARNFQTGKYLDSSGSISVRNVPAGSYDAVVRMMPGAGSTLASVYAPMLVGGILISGDDVTSHAIKDLGIWDLRRGIQVNGTVTDKATGLSLANILMAALPSNRGRFASVSTTRTDKQGRYQLVGLDPAVKHYTIVASPRSAQQFGQESLVDRLIQGKRYGEAKRSDVDISGLITEVNFSLSEATGAIKGTVAAADNGDLAPGGPVGTDYETGAAVFLQGLSNFSSDDPLGDIRVTTKSDGSFVIGGLVRGSYRVRILAKGYASKVVETTVSTGATQLGPLTLVNGGRVSGTITKPDGASPSTEEVGGVVAVTSDFSDLLFGALVSDDATKTVSEYAIEGLKSGATYTVLLYPKEEGKSGPPDQMIDVGTVSVTLASESKELNLVYQESPPTFIARFAKSGNGMDLKFFCSQPLRNLTSDDRDPSKLLTLKKGSGALTGLTLSADRRLISAFYTPPAKENKLTVNLLAYGNSKDPATGDSFRVDQDFEFYVGFDGQGAENIHNLMGGEVKIEGDASKATFPTGAFSVGLTSSARVELYKVATTTEGAPKYAAQFYPEATYARFVKAPTLSGVFSNYYDVFLKTGELASGKSYSLALAYDSSVTETDTLNVYYLDDTSNQWKKEDTDRSVDATNHTISVQLNHASRFVVVNSNAATIGGTAYTGSDFTAFNFPNPFDLQTKTVTLSKAAGGSTATITGTEIRYTLPSVMTGDVSFQFYNLAGEKVRTITETNKSGGFYYYVEWDGKNDDGSEVASGVYLCVAKAPGVTKTFKLAVVK